MITCNFVLMCAVAFLVPHYDKKTSVRLQKRGTLNIVNIALRRFLHNHGNIVTEGSPEPGVRPTLISNDSTLHAHYMLLNSLGHCKYTATMTNIRANGDSNLVPSGYKPQLIRMSYLGRSSAPWKIRTWSKLNQRGIVTFQVPIIFGLGFMSFCRGHFEFLLRYFYYDRLIGILRMSFLAAILNWNFRLQTSNFRDQKSPLSFCTSK